MNKNEEFWLDFEAKAFIEELGPRPDMTPEEREIYNASWFSTTQVELAKKYLAKQKTKTNI
jgi:hypothetical protein